MGYVQKRKARGICLAASVRTVKERGLSTRTRHVIKIKSLMAWWGYVEGCRERGKVGEKEQWRCWLIYYDVFSWRCRCAM